MQYSRHLEIKLRSCTLKENKKQRGSAPPKYTVISSIFEFLFWIFAFRFRIFHFRFSLFDYRFWSLDFRFAIFDVRFWIIDFGFSLCDFQCSLFDFRISILFATYYVPKLHFNANCWAISVVGINLGVISVINVWADKKVVFLVTQIMTWRTRC